MRFDASCAQPQPSWGGEVTSQKTCTFLRTNLAQLSQGGAAAASQEPSPVLRPPGGAVPDLSVLPFPKRCLTGFVLTEFIHVSVVPAWGSCFVLLFPHQIKQG